MAELLQKQQHQGCKKNKSFIDRVPYFSYSTKNTFSLNTANIATFINIRHPVTILVTVLTNPDNLTSDLTILKLLLYLITHQLIQVTWPPLELTNLFFQIVLHNHYQLNYIVSNEGKFRQFSFLINICYFPESECSKKFKLYFQESTSSKCHEFNKLQSCDRRTGELRNVQSQNQG